VASPDGKYSVSDGSKKSRYSGESFLFLNKEDKTVTTKDTKEHKGMRKT
jgi:hypothetical protein